MAAPGQSRHPKLPGPFSSHSHALPSPVLEVTFCLGSLLCGSEAAET